jgi:predicted nucleic acid-binding protein
VTSSRTSGARRVRERARLARSAAADVLLDTGVLVAAYARDDPYHLAATRWLAGFHGTLHTVEPVLTEAAYFLPVRLRAVIAELVEQRVLHVHHPDAAAYARIAALLRKYADLDPDWADVALVWLAEAANITRIATVDIADFSVYRVHGRKRFELELLR